MARAKYQVLVIPYHIENGNVKYCIFKRHDMKAVSYTHLDVYKRQEDNFGVCCLAETLVLLNKQKLLSIIIVTKIKVNQL